MNKALLINADKYFHFQSKFITTEGIELIIL